MRLGRVGHPCTIAALLIGRNRNESTGHLLLLLLLKVVVSVGRCISYRMADLIVSLGCKLTTRWSVLLIGQPHDDTDTIEGGKVTIRRPMILVQ